MNDRDVYDTRPFFEHAIKFVREHPGLGVSIGYGVVSLIGIMFSWSLFYHFDITYFQYADISDFLLAAIREPMTFIMSASAIVVAMLLIRSSYYSQKFYKKYSPKFFLFRWLYAIDKFGTTGVGFIFVLIAYSFLFIAMYGDWKAHRIRQGAGINVHVTMTSEAAAAMAAHSGEQLILLGTTSRYVFLYSPQDEQSFIIPAENIASLSPYEPRRDATPQQAPSIQATENVEADADVEAEPETIEQTKTEKETD